MTLTRDQILNSDDAKPKKVEVPEWDGAVYVRALSGDHMDMWETKYLGGRGAKTGNRGLRATLVAYSACDEKGCLLFEEKDIADLGRKSKTALDRVFEAACRANGIGDEEQETIEKN